MITQLVCEECGKGGSPEAPGNSVLILDRPAQTEAEAEEILAKHMKACHGVSES